MIFGDERVCKGMTNLEKGQKRIEKDDRGLRRI